MAKKTDPKPTYEHAFSTLFDLSPSLYKEVTRIIKHKNVNETAKLFIEQAHIKSLTGGKEVSAIRKRLNRTLPK